MTVIFGTHARRLGLWVVLLTLPAAIATAQSSCEGLSSLSYPETTITLAETVTAGAFVPPSGGAAPFANLPAFCRVAGTIAPTNDSSIKFEVWMPLNGWNGKFMGVGGSGLSGGIYYDVPPLNTAWGLAQGLAHGYATAATDGGHAGPESVTAAWAIAHHEKVVDFGYRAVHEMTLKTKAVVSAFYGRELQHSYWFGCSEGGNQGLSEAQRYPADYDGILAGAPANYFTHLMAEGIWVTKAVHMDPASFVPNPLAASLNAAVLAACDALDGVADGVLEDPRRCRFDVASLQCSGSNNSNCLTAAQVEGVKRVYAGPKNPRTGEQIFPGLVPGSEFAWPGWVTGVNLNFGLFVIVNPALRDMVFEDPNWDWKTFDFDWDVASADARAAHALNQTNPDLRIFRSLGGKMIQYHGWSDPAISPLNSINYYNSVVAAMGSLLEIDAPSALSDTQGYYRLFMAPGLAHCGVPGTSSFDGIAALDQWVTEGKAPDQIIMSGTTNGRVDRTRPLCPYPKVAQWRGSGNIEDAENFACVDPRQ